MGGVAVRIQAPSAAPAAVRARPTATSTSSPTTRTSAALRRLLEREGYVGDKLFNAIHGAQRLVYARGRRSLVGRRRDRRAGDVAHDRPARAPGDRWSDARPGRPAPDQAPDLGDEPEGPRRRGLPRWPTIRWRAIGRPAATGPDGSPGADRPGPDRSVLGADWGFCHTAERNLRADRRARRRQPDPGGAVRRSRPRSRALLADIDGRAEDARLEGPGTGRRARPLVRDARGGAALRLRPAPSPAQAAPSASASRQ